MARIDWSPGFWRWWLSFAAMAGLVGAVAAAVVSTDLPPAEGTAIGRLVAATLVSSLAYGFGAFLYGLVPPAALYGLIDGLGDVHHGPVGVILAAPAVVLLALVGAFWAILRPRLSASRRLLLGTALAIPASVYLVRVAQGAG